MIQRIQTLLLLLTVLFLTVQAFTPMILSPTTEPQGVFQDGRLFVSEYTVSLALLASSIIASFLTIWLFKNRKLQKNLVILSILLIIACNVAGYFYFFPSGQPATTTVQAGLKPGIGALFPLLGLILLVLAYRFIDKDEKIVKSMDRLR